MANRQTSQFTDATERVLGFLAWASIIALVILTIVPADLRPTTPLPHSVEHIAAFAIAGTFVGLSFRLHPLALSMSGVVFAACLEMLQLGLPTRHPRLTDFLENTLGSWIGLAIGLSLLVTILRRGRLT
jgi:VanZ family protein